MHEVTPYFEEVLQLLKLLIATPSFSKEENHTAAILKEFFQFKYIDILQVGNNIAVRNKYFSEKKPTILLNSHLDTVKPNASYSHNPFEATESEGKLYGLGSNDAGGSVAALLGCFLYYFEKKDLQYNLIFAASAEEEISGSGGIESLLRHLPPISCAIVGEPTQMQMAVSEMGLLVVDCTAKGVAGHAARTEGVNAIYNAMGDIDWFRQYQLPKISPTLGACKMTVTQINTPNKAHNVIPDLCHFTVDIRVNELYNLEEIISIIKSNVSCEIVPRSLRLRSTSITEDHVLVQSGVANGLSMYGSPTLSDKALMPFPALKLGPGNSKRSHIADEYIYIDEIKNGIDIYIALLKNIL